MASSIAVRRASSLSASSGPTQLSPRSSSFMPTQTPTRALPILPVAPPVIHDGGTEEPGVAVVERPRFEGEAVERRAALPQTQQLLAGAHAEIAGERDARPAIAHGVVQAVLHADMGHCIEGISDEPDPGMGDPRGGELGEDADHLGMEP